MAPEVWNIIKKVLEKFVHSTFVENKTITIYLQPICRLVLDEISNNINDILYRWFQQKVEVWTEMDGRDMSRSCWNIGKAILRRLLIELASCPGPHCSLSAADGVTINRKRREQKSVENVRGNLFPPSVPYKMIAIYIVYSSVPFSRLVSSLSALLQRKLELKRQSYPCNRPWRPIGLWDVEAPTSSTQSGHRWRWGFPPHSPAALYPRRRFLILISVSCWGDTRSIVRLEGLGQGRQHAWL
jgi:hypothetical protein